MARDYFSKAASGSTSPSGTVISDVQQALNASGPLQIGTDGLFGGQTQSALRAFQMARNLPATGTVNDAVWPLLMHTAEPPIFERCLQVTASFEGTGFTLVVGNFDGAGITWGIIGFTLVNGELGAVLTAVSQRYPDLIGKAFGDDAAQIMKISGNQTSKADRIAWADTVSRGTQKYNVTEPWKTYFHDFGSYREVQKIQVDRARDIYWSIATRDAQKLGMAEELDLLLLYDIAVQNGGMGSKNRMQNAKAAFAQQNPGTALKKREIVAEVVADTIGDKYREDVRSRKLSIARGAGTVHQGGYKLSDWGFLDGITPAST